MFSLRPAEVTPPGVTMSFPEKQTRCHLGLLTLISVAALLLTLPPLLQAVDFPDKYQNPQTLRKDLIKFRRQFDTVFGKPDDSPCKELKEGLGNDELAKGYVDIDEFIEKLGFSDFLFKPLEEGDKIINTAYAAYLKLSKFYDDNKSSATPFSICPLSRSLSCPEKGNGSECRCATNWRLDAENDRVKTVTPDNLEIIHLKQNGHNCTLSEGSVCREDWQIKCNYPLKCFVKEGDKQPENELICSYRNLEKYELTEDAKTDEEMCSCRFVEKDIINMISFLYTKVVNAPNHLNFGEDCDADAKKFDANFEKLVDYVPILHPIPRKEVMKYYTDSHEEIHYLFGKATEGRFCSKKEWMALWCGPQSKCTCLDEVGVAVRDGEKKPCVYKTNSSPCKRPEQLYKYECEEGSECLVKIAPLGIYVPCSLGNFKDILKLETAEGKIMTDDGTVSCICHAKSEPVKVKQHFSQDDLAELQGHYDQLTKAVVKDLERKCRDSLDVKQTPGETCDWEEDRQFFQLDDFIRADLLHVYARLHKYYPPMKELCKQPKQPKMQICDPRKGLRCEFIKNKCGCPTEHHLLKEITSVWNTKLGRCEINPKNMRCHPTTDEWIPCPEGTICLYDNREVKFKCDRKTRQKIIDKGMILKNATCRCSDDKHFYTHETISDKIAKTLHRSKDEF